MSAGPVDEAGVCKDTVGESQIGYHLGGVGKPRLSANRYFYSIDGTFQSRLVNSLTASERKEKQYERNIGNYMEAKKHSEV